MVHSEKKEIALKHGNGKPVTVATFYVISWDIDVWAYETFDIAKFLVTHSIDILNCDLNVYRLQILQAYNPQFIVCCRSTKSALGITIRNRLMKKTQVKLNSKFFFYE